MYPLSAYTKPGDCSCPVTGLLEKGISDMVWGIVGFLLGLIAGVVLTCLTQIGRLYHEGTQDEQRNQ